jgi:hypothetical protein
MITQLMLVATDGDREAVEQTFQDVISRVMSATMEVNPPGEWECQQESYGVSYKADGEKQCQGAMTFIFTQSDNLAKDAS